jgi:hypothetical protein
VIRRWWWLGLVVACSSKSMGAGAESPMDADAVVPAPDATSGFDAAVDAAVSPLDVAPLADGPRADTSGPAPDAAADAPAADVGGAPDTAAIDRSADLSGQDLALGPARNCVPNRVLPAWTSVPVVQVKGGALRGGGIALDAQGLPWVAVVQDEQTALAHARMLDRATGGVLWTINPVRVGNGTVTLSNWPSDLRVDPAGHARAAFYLQTPNVPAAWTINLATATGAPMEVAQFETVTKSASTAKARLALDASGVPHLAYGAGGTYRHAYKPAGTWIEESTTLPVRLPSGVDTATWSLAAIAVDGAGTIAVAGINGGEEINVAVRSNGVWTRELSFSQAGFRVVAPTLFFDEAGALHFLFLSPQSFMRHAVRAGGVWGPLYPIVDGIGEEMAAAPGKNGQIHVIATQRHLDYFFFNGTCWSESEIEPDFGHAYLALTADAAGRPHASYYTRSSDTAPVDFRYAYQVGTP